MPPYDIAVLTTGDELLSGEISDSNTKTIAGILSNYGFRLRCSLSVPDQEKEEVVKEALDNQRNPSPELDLYFVRKIDIQGRQSTSLREPD